MVVVDKVSPVGAGSVSAGRQGALVAEPRPRPRPHPRQHQPRDHTGRRGRGETRLNSVSSNDAMCRTELGEEATNTRE